MTINLTYLDDYGRIRIEATGLPGVPVSVEKSISTTTDKIWEYVRGGIEMLPNSGAIELYDSEFVTEVETFYRIVPQHIGLYIPGSGFAQSNDHSSFDITGDITLRADATLRNWARGANQGLVGKFVTTTNQRSYLFRVTDAGFLQFVWTTNGQATTQRTITSKIPVPAAPGQRLAVEVSFDVNDGAGNCIATFRVAPTMAGPWSELGDPVVAVSATSIHSGSAPLIAGAWGSGTTEVMDGTLHSIQVINSAGNTVASPNFASRPFGTSSFQDAQGRTWSIQGSAVLTGQEIERASITPPDDGIWLVNPLYPSLNRRIVVQEYSGITREPRDAVFLAKDRSNPLSVGGVRGPRQFTLRLATDNIFPDAAVDAPTQAAMLDLILASGHVFFIRVPSDRRMPGGYIRVGRTSSDRIVRKGDYTPQYIELECTQAEPYGPDIEAAFYTYRALANQFGSYTAVAAAHNAYKELLTHAANPEDFLVP